MSRPRWIGRAALAALLAQQNALQGAFAEEADGLRRQGDELG